MTGYRQLIRIIHTEHFYEKSCRKPAPKASPRPFLILANRPKQPLHARNCFKDILKENYQKALNM